MFDVRAWLAGMEAGELDGWVAYYNLEPWDRPATPQQTSSTTPGMISIKDAAQRLSSGRS